MRISFMVGMIRRAWSALADTAIFCALPLQRISWSGNFVAICFRFSGIRYQGSGIRWAGFSAKMYLKLRVQGNHSPAGENVEIGARKFAFASAACVEMADAHREKVKK
jgi:hypothetical protein